MPRPTKKHKKVPANITLEPSLKDAAIALAYENNESLSELITRLLEEEIADSSPTNIPSAAEIRAAEIETAEILKRAVTPTAPRANPSRR